MQVAVVVAMVVSSSSHTAGRTVLTSSRGSTPQHQLFHFQLAALVI